MQNRGEGSVTVIQGRNAHHQQSGFTMIELIMVIVILGVLAAFAVPRFADLGEDAAQSATQGARAAVLSAAAIAHSETLAEGNGATTSVVLEGTTIGMVNFYPTSENIDLAANITSTDYTVVDTSGTVVTISKSASGVVCSFTYTEAASGASPAISAVTCS